jgi:hypothetical protein
MFTPTPIRSVEDAIKQALFKGGNDASLARGFDTARILDLARQIDEAGVVQLLAGCDIELKFSHGVSDWRTAGVGTLKNRQSHVAA